MLDVLTRYIRTQFKNPIPTPAKGRESTENNSPPKMIHQQQRKLVPKNPTKGFYSDDEDDDEDDEDEVDQKQRTPLNTNISSGNAVRSTTLAGVGTGDISTDSRFQNDHRLALRASLPLLKSRNAGVVLAVCSLHFYCGSDDTLISHQMAKAMVRILRSRREIQLVVLNSIKSMVNQRPHMFANYVQDFFVKASDPIFNRYCK